MLYSRPLFLSGSPSVTFANLPMRRYRRPVSVLTALVLLAFNGCASSKNTMLGDTWAKMTGKNKVSLGPNVQTPTERMEKMRELAKKASTMSPTEQEAEAVALAKVIQKEDDPLIRAQIVRTVGAFDCPTATALMAASAKDSDRDVRVACCQAWAQRKGPEAMQMLSGMLSSDADVDVRLAAVRGLGELADPSTVVALATALEDPNPAMQYRAVQSLKQATGKDFGDDVKVWRDFARGAEPPEASIATKLRRLF